jgi:hypothetical protein
MAGVSEEGSQRLKPHETGAIKTVLGLLEAVDAIKMRLESLLPTEKETVAYARKHGF